MILLYSFFILSILAFVITAYDKRLAIKNKRRISEQTLLALTFIGGTIGTGLAMLICKHKTSKTSFLWKYFLLAVIQIIILYFYVIKFK
jgi:uncharacterized membrane protein YsdA (DUF1294 family)